MIPCLLHASYDISGPAAKLMDSDTEFIKLCHEVRSNLRLAVHNGERLEPPIAKDIYGTLLFLDVLESRFDDAEADIAQLRSLSEKLSVRLTTHIATYSIIQAMRRDGLPSVMREHLENVLANLPWELVGSEIRFVQEESWSSPSAADIRVTIPGKPGDMNGTTTLTQAGDDVVQQIDLAVKVSIPLVGGKVEDLIAGFIGKAFQAENKVGVKWLRGEWRL